MKFCPNCRTQYTDDTLQYCLQDGTPLSFAEEAGETETVVSPKINEPLRFDLPAQNRPTIEQNRVTNATVFPPEPKKSNAFLIVLATAFAMLLLFGIVGAGAWFYFRNQGEIAKNTAENQNSQPNSNTKTNVNKSPTPTANTWANVITENAAPEKTPIPAAEKEKIKTDVVNRINDWKSDGEAIDLDSYMQNYAPTVDYYNKKGATAAQVRSDKLRAFSQFDSISIDITNMTVTPDATGETATAVFDKEWFFESDVKSSSGKVRQELRFRKINNKWLIAGEKDLKLYYKN